MPDAPAVASASDAQLIKAVARGDHSAVETLYRTHCDAILRFVWRRMPTRFEDAQEIAQDTFLSALRLAATFRGDSSAYVWLCGIARVRTIDFLRKQGREKRVPPEMVVRLDEAAEIPAQISAEEAVDHLMEVLNPDEREAMMLRYVDELPVRDIAHMLGRSEKGIENLLLRAKQKQRLALAAKGARL